MSERVELRDFEAVELFRAALVRFIEAANGALTSGEVEISRTLNWLEGEQIPHWKLLLRSTAEDLERAKMAYREKKNYKDASGARQSAIDELKIMRRIEAKREEVEKRAKATRWNLRQLQREASMYHGSAHHLRGAVNGKLAVAAQELRGVVEQLEKYVQVAPEALPPELAAGGMARAWPQQDGGHSASDGENTGAPAAAADAATDPSETQGAHVTSSADLELAASLRARTPAASVRRAAARGESNPLLPEVSPEATEVLRPHLKGSEPGRYDLITMSVGPGDDSGDVYLHRNPPSGAGDSGWHIGSVEPAEEAPPCVTISASRLAVRRPELAALLALPEGSFMLARRGKLALVMDAWGQVLWRASHGRGDG